MYTLESIEFVNLTVTDTFTRSHASIRNFEDDGFLRLKRSRDEGEPERRENPTNILYPKTFPTFELLVNSIRGRRFCFHVDSMPPSNHSSSQPPFSMTLRYDVLISP